MLTAHHWEINLLDMAHDALDSHGSAAGSIAEGTAADRFALEAAYHRSEEITRARRRAAPGRPPGAPSCGRR